MRDILPADFLNQSVLIRVIRGSIHLRNLRVQHYINYVKTIRGNSWQEFLA